MNIKWAESLDMQNLNLLADHPNRKEKREKLYWELFLSNKKQQQIKRIKGKALKHFTELRKISWKSPRFNKSFSGRPSSRPFAPTLSLICIYSVCMCFPIHSRRISFCQRFSTFFPPRSRLNFNSNSVRCMHNVRKKNRWMKKRIYVKVTVWREWMLNVE